MQLCSAHTEMQFRAIASSTLRRPCSNFVCAGKQVFTKIRGNPSLNSKQKGARSGALFRSWMQQSMQILAKQLALRELERLARLRPAVLLALHGAGVAGQEAAFLQNAAQIRLEVGQSLGDAVTHGTRLARQTAASDRADDVVLAGARGGDQRLLDQHAQDRASEIDFDFAGVDHDLAGARLDPDA